MDESPNNGSLPNSNILPWFARKERAILAPTSVQIEPSLKPGEYVMRNLFAEFIIQADKKITAVMAEPFVSTTALSICHHVANRNFSCSGAFPVKILAKRRGSSV